LQPPFSLGLLFARALLMLAPFVPSLVLPQLREATAQAPSPNEQMMMRILSRTLKTWNGAENDAAMLPLRDDGEQEKPRTSY
jgi:hypothetical protein